MCRHLSIRIETTFLLKPVEPDAQVCYACDEVIYLEPKQLVAHVTVVKDTQVFPQPVFFCISCGNHMEEALKG